MVAVERGEWNCEMSAWTWLGEMRAGLRLNGIATVWKGVWCVAGDGVFAWLPGGGGVGITVCVCVWRGRRH